MDVQGTIASFFPPPLVRIILTAVPIAVICYFVSGLHDQTSAPGTMTPEAVAARLRPVAQLVLAGAPEGAPSALQSGQAVYESVCSACHGGGIAGAPKFGDRKAWTPRIAQGFDVLVKHAIDGFSGRSGMMPPKGGGAFEDVEVARAVAYMADKAGAKFAEPTAPAK